MFPVSWSSSRCREHVGRCAFSLLNSASGVMVRRSVPHGYPLVARFALVVLPRNIQHVGFVFTRQHFQTFHLILLCAGRLTANPCAVRQNCFLFWFDRLDRVKSYVRLRRAARRLPVFEEDCENL